MSLGLWGSGVVGWSAAGQRRDEVDFAGCSEAVAQASGRNHTIDGDRDAWAQLLPGGEALGEAGEVRVQVGEHGADGVTVRRNALGTRGQVAVVGWNPDGVDHSACERAMRDLGFEKIQQLPD